MNPLEPSIYPIRAEDIAAALVADKEKTLGNIQARIAQLARQEQFPESIVQAHDSLSSHELTHIEAENIPVANEMQDILTENSSLEHFGQKAPTSACSDQVQKQKTLLEQIEEEKAVDTIESFPDDNNSVDNKLISLSKHWRDLCVNDPKWAGIFTGNNTCRAMDSMVNVLQCEVNVPRSKRGSKKISKISLKPFFIKLYDPEFSKLNYEEIRGNLHVNLQSSLSVLLSFKHKGISIKFLESDCQINGLLIKIENQNFKFNNPSDCKIITRQVSHYDNDARLLAKTKRYICVKLLNKSYIIQIVCLTSNCYKILNYFDNIDKLINLSTCLRSMHVVQTDDSFDSIKRLVAQKDYLPPQAQDLADNDWKWKILPDPNHGTVVLANAINFASMRPDYMDKLLQPNNIENQQTPLLKLKNKERRSEPLNKQKTKKIKTCDV